MLSKNVYLTILKFMCCYVCMYLFIYRQSTCKQTPKRLFLFLYSYAIVNFPFFSTFNCDVKSPNLLQKHWKINYSGTLAFHKEF